MRQAALERDSHLLRGTAWCVGLAARRAARFYPPREAHKNGVRRVVRL